MDKIKRKNISQNDTKSAIYLTNALFKNTQ